MPRLTLKLLFVALMTGVAGAIYATWLNPEIQFWQAVAERKLSWVKQMRATHGHVIGVVGGSTTTFAINAGMIEREYGLPVANLGLHAGVGPQACAGFGLTALKSGDTIVVSLEPSLLSGRDTGTGSLATRLAYALDKPEMLHWQSGVGLTSRAADLTKLQPGGSHVITMLSKLALGIPLYRYSADNSLPGGLQVTAERRDFTVNSAITSEEAEISLSPEGESLLREVRQEAKKRGIRVVYVLPSAYSSEQSAAIQRQANSRLLDQVESIMPVLRESEMGVISHRDAFSDSSQHLTFEAANQRSSNFATAIIRYIQSEENCISP